MPSESPRIAELRRRVEADPSSIAFAQLAEEYRRAGNFEASEQVCRTGLTRHPGYLSARVTLGRALIELDKLDEAESELNFVLKSAPDNLAAIRGMAEIHQRRDNLELALDFYRRALPLARHDPEIEENVRKINEDLGANRPKDDPGLSFTQAQAEFLNALNQLPALARSEPAAPPMSPPSPAEPEPSAAPVAAIAPAVGDVDKVDFDSLLKSLGVPDHQPPAGVEELLTEPDALVATPEPVLPDLPLTTEPGDPFADLERGLRDLDAPTSPLSPPEEQETVATSEATAKPGAGYGEWVFEEPTPEPIAPPAPAPAPAAPAPAARASAPAPALDDDGDASTETYILEELEAWLAAIKR